MDLWDWTIWFDCMVGPCHTFLQHILVFVVDAFTIENIFTVTKKIIKDHYYSLDPSYTFAVDCVLDRERNLSTQWKEYPCKKISIANHKNLRDFLNKIRMADVGSTFYYKGYPSLCVGAYISSHLEARSILSVFYVYELKAFDMVNISVSSESEPIKYYEQNFEPLF